MSGKRVYWVSMARWMNLTIEEHRNLELYCRDMGMELGIDLIGEHASEQRAQVEFQKDHDDERNGDWTR